MITIQQNIIFDEFDGFLSSVELRSVPTQQSNNPNPVNPPYPTNFCPNRTKYSTPCIYQIPISRKPNLLTQSYIYLSPMSIYSGFATRFQQQSYDHCIDSLLYILQKRIIKFYQNDTADEQKFITLVLRLHQQMRNMEKSKYLDPKSSQSVNELIRFMQLYHTNLSVQNNQSQSLSEQVPPVEHLPSQQPESNEQKKKNTFWVEKKPQEDTNAIAQQNATNPSTNNQQKYSPEGRTQFRRTSFNSGVIKRVKMRATSRTNINKDQLPQTKEPINNFPKSVNARIVNNYHEHLNSHQSKTPQSSNDLAYQTEMNHIRKKKKKSGSRSGLNQTDGQLNEVRNDVSDIIREYITKAKRTFARGHRFRESKDYPTKLHDF